MPKTVINTTDAPQAIGAYSQAVQSDKLVFISGQIPLDPASGELVTGDAAGQIDRVLQNLAAVCQAAGGDLDDIIKLSVFLTDLADFPLVNAAMERDFSRPFPARAVVEVSSLPKGARVEIEAILQKRDA